MNLRFKTESGENKFPHILNGSGTALARLFVALDRNASAGRWQHCDSAALQPYLKTDIESRRECTHEGRSRQWRHVSEPSFDVAVLWRLTAVIRALLADDLRMKILLASSEVHPYSKTGGLADMVGALAKIARPRRAQVGVVTPLYRGIREVSRIQAVRLEL